MPCRAMHISGVRIKLNISFMYKSVTEYMQYIYTIYAYIKCFNSSRYDKA